MLRETFRVEPSDETVFLYRQILAGEVPAVSLMPANNLPFWLTPLIGRQSEVNWVQFQLATPPCRLITITGPSGIGKTHLALEAVKAKLNRFPDGVFLVSLAELTSAQDIIPILVQVLNLPFQDNVDLRRQLFDYLRPKTLLLILDSFEYLIAAPGFASQSGTKIVCDLLEEIPRLKILITSRTRLNLHGEHVLTLNGLSYPPEPANYQSSDVVEPDEYSAITLFLNSALRLRPGYIPTAADLVDIGRICRQVRGMPLAILLAASWVELLKPRDIAEEIEQNLDFLTMESGNIPWRHRSLRAVFNHSLRLLSDRERAILLSLSVFRGGFTRIAAQAVVGASAQDLRYFVNRSLLRRFSEDRFTLHPLLRYYAAENLVANPEVNTRVCNQHCTFYTAASHDWMMLYKGPHQQAGIQQMKREIHNLQVAWRWAVKQRDRPSLAQGLDGLCTYCTYHNRYQEGIDICRDAARMIDKEQSPAGLRLMSRLLAWQSTFSMKLGRMEEALRLSQQALIILQDSLLAGEDFRPEKAFALLQFAQQLTECDLGKAEQLAKESVKLYQDLEDESGTADALEALAEVAWLSANYREAHDGYQRCLSIRRAIGDRHRIANLLGILGFVCFQLGDFGQAERLIHEGINLKQHLRDVNGATDTLFNLAMAMLWIGGCEEVNNLLSLAIASYHKSGAVIEAAKLQALQAMAQTLLGQYDEAREIAESSLALARNNRLEREIGILLWVLGFLSIAAGDYISAEQQLMEAHQILVSLGLLDISAAAQVALGYAALGLEDLGLARQRFAEALQGQPGPQSRGVALLTLPGIALLMAQIGHISFSVAVDTLATRFPLITKAPFFNDVARQPLAALLTDVHEAVLAQAKAHGEGLDLDTAVIEILKALKQLPLSTE
jgi:predicted ATPase